MTTHKVTEEAGEQETRHERAVTGLYDLARKVLLAGIGAAVLAQDEMSGFVDRLVERGEIAEKDARHLMREVLERREKLEREKRYEEQRNRPAAATKADIEALSARIAELSRKLEELQNKP